MKLVYFKKPDVVVLEVIKGTHKQSVVASMELPINKEIPKSDLARKFLGFVWELLK